MTRRTSHRCDANQTAIVEALRKAGCSVAITSSSGDGFPDIVAGKNGVNWLIEIKDGNKPPSQQRLTDGQARFHDDWEGQICVINSVDDALELISLKKMDYYKDKINNK